MPRPFLPKNRAATEHIGSIDRVVFASPDKDFVILGLKDGATALGMANVDDFAVGAAFRFLGKWEDSPERGLRFRFSAAVHHTTHTRGGVVAYVSKFCSGFGEKTADRVWQKFGGDAVELLRTDPLRVSLECRIDPDVCRTAAEELARIARFEATKVDLFSLTSGRGFTAAFIDTAIDKWGVHAPRLIRRNPLVAIGLPSAGFRRCDKLWCDLGLPKEAPKRAAILASHLVKTNRDGHTWIGATELGEQLVETAPGCDLRRSLKLALRSRKLKKRPDSNGKLWLANYANAAAEERVAANVKRLLGSRSLWPTDRIPVSETDGDRLPSAHQVERLRRATRWPVGLFLGGPGTGKTFTLAFLLREIVAEHGYSSVAVAAPTGKAATRCTQAVRSAGLDILATTIHSLLQIGRNGHDGDGWGFMRNARNPLDARFLVIDEGSMIDCTLMADLLDAVPTGGHVLLIGDSAQLPPVGHGAPLRDLIAAGLPHGELTQVRRNAGQIVHACVRIKNGESFEVADGIDLDATPPKNLLLEEARGEEAQVERLLSLVKSFPRFDPVWQTQVIVARNTKGGVSRTKLNDLLHPLLNPEGKSLDGNPFKVDDKIICLRNCRMPKVDMYAFAKLNPEAFLQDAAQYDTVRDEDGQPELCYVANGEIGRVVAISKGLMVARFSEADTLVKIPVGKQRDKDDEDDDSGAEGEKGRGCNFDLAYAISCHKCQGAESPCVIVMGDAGAFQLTTREWAYTAISRASKLCILIGQMSTFDKMRSKIALRKRRTFLKEMVQEVLWEGL